MVYMLQTTKMTSKCLVIKWDHESQASSFLEDFGVICIICRSADRGKFLCI